MFGRSRSESEQRELIVLVLKYKGGAIQHRPYQIIFYDIVIIFPVSY